MGPAIVSRLLVEHPQKYRSTSNICAIGCSLLPSNFIFVRAHLRRSAARRPSASSVDRHRPLVWTAPVLGLMQTHHSMSQYQARIVWKRQPKERFVDLRYSRAHEWEFDGGATVPASSAVSSVPLPYLMAENVGARAHSASAEARANNRSWAHPGCPTARPPGTDSSSRSGSWVCRSPRAHRSAAHGRDADQNYGRVHARASTPARSSCRLRCPIGPT